MKKVLDQIFGHVPEAEDGALKEIARARSICEAEGVEYPERPEVRLSLRLITPRVAEELLGNMITNRQPSQRQIDRLEAEMKNGTFYLINQGIGVLENGQTADGQHRLRAIVKSGKPQWMIVVSGISAEAMRAIDRGRCRTIANVLEIAGRPHAKEFAAAAKVVLKAETAWGVGLKLSSAQAQGFTDGAEVDLLEEMYEKVDASALAAAARKLYKGGVPPSVGGAFYYLARNHKEWVEEFATDVEGSPAGKAGHQLDRKCKYLSAKKASQVEVLAYAIVAFSKFVEAKRKDLNEDVRRLTLPRDGKLPRLPEA